MTFGSRTDKCKRINNYSQALMFFTRYPKPRSSKWADNERPIYISDGKPSTRMYQYRMAAGPIDATTGTPAYFDLVLHDTSVIRYEAPTEDNKRAVYLTYGGWPTLQTRSFMYQHGWHYAQEILTTHDTSVAVPLNPEAKSAHWVAGQWIAKLVFNEANRLIVDDSDHMTVYRRKSSNDDRAVRAAMRRKLDILHDMMWFSIEGIQADLRESVDTNYNTNWMRQRYFGPFTSALDKLNVNYKQQIVNARAEFLYDDVDFTEQTLAALNRLYMCVYQYVYGRAAYDQQWGPAPEAPTQDAVKKAATSYIMNMIGIGKGTEYEPLPKFMLASEFPRRHYTSPR